MDTGLEERGSVDGDRSAPARFRKAQKLLSSRDYRRVSRRGKRRSSRCFVVLEAPSAVPSAGARLGITASRKVGNAVARNRVKRAIREWFRHHQRELPSRDFVVIARREAASLRAPALGEELSKMFERVEAPESRS